MQNKIYVNCYYYCDLLTICDLAGNLKYNIYGPGWLKNKDNQKNYYFNAFITSKNIYASYLGEKGIYYDEFNRQRGKTPTKLLVFDLNGTYEETLDTGHKIYSFCVDERNNRVIICFSDRANPLGYFDLNSIQL